ncbi:MULTISPECIES: LysM peptidoglycan-binding domain-containing protein [unclassified Rhodococcus (in: high G+C Gram-positive bacteria)]|uniref:LysM peptidoglycan-binding domain-containing protein n=1 Tax=unclassified Rhodococcus (in: high G+C Gram-positive bacteria) TaxID=192944 RepID=UPI001639C94A|nr:MULTISPECIES: LysM peptidoglycan-binding domain-containing protein [unclassified Rhodococcus (in: high G+C Gram-positive bacteria)]MBC2643897.1 LysM peptidoglycan-binding domain-containing protein [Rhodococcus sp. 3A]MBC2891363.1 LysM peptidoglycan-binding domain-containing protein [Rhodococcus sp. 4CII]
MSNAVLPRQAVVNRQAVLNRHALERGAVRSGAARSYRTEPSRRGLGYDLRRPSSGAVEYRPTVVGVSRADHRRGANDVGWRMVLASVVITAGVLCGLVGLAQLATTDSAGDAAATEVVQVQQGESLAAIAGRVAPDLPVAQVVERIMELNAMSNSALHPGQNLIVPSSATR